ncbi:MAG: hypothetical protein ACRDAU_00600 [Clostridium sp.]
MAKKKKTYEENLEEQQVKSYKKKYNNENTYLEKTGTLRKS